VSESLLLTDTDDPSVAEAVSRMDGWRIERLPESTPAEASEFAGVRLILLYEQNPSALRMWTEYAHGIGVPVVAAVNDDASRRRAVELRVEEWYDRGASPDEIASRIRSALARGIGTTSDAAGRAERTEFQEMLHDTLTGLPTLPVAIDRIRAQFKEGGELVVIYLKLVR
jgi:hypothetical protein